MIFQSMYYTRRLMKIHGTVSNKECKTKERLSFPLRPRSEGFLCKLTVCLIILKEKRPKGRFLVLQHLVLQPRIVRNQGDKLRVCRLSACILDGVAEEGV